MAFQDELSTAKAAARRAADVMERHQRDGVSIGRKDSYTDLVTEADHAVQETVVETIAAEFPGDGFLAEEDDLRPEGEDRVWVIDPIDGTTNFAHGFPYYCTSIALQVDGEPVVGVVNRPPQEELFTAVRGGGASLNGTPIQVSGVDDLRDGLIAARLTDWDINGGLIEREQSLLEDIVRTPSSFRRPGAAAIDLCQIAVGRLDGQALVTINRWDVAAGELILEEAGGTARIQDAVFDGYLELVASNGHLQDDLEEVFDRNVRR